MVSSARPRCLREQRERAHCAFVREATTILTEGAVPLRIEWLRGGSILFPSPQVAALDGECPGASSWLAPLTPTGLTDTSRPDDPGAGARPALRRAESLGVATVPPA
jgi:hypothetical protein